MRSVHSFQIGDRVAYSVTLCAVPEKNLRKRHINGRGIILRHIPHSVGKDEYEIETPRGLIKRFYVHELRKL
jgi:hypothetical protein